MLADAPGLLDAIRDRFAHVEACPFVGPRVFFENAGGALTLKSVVETSARFAAIPDNQGRDNPASHALMDVIAKAKADIRRFLNAPGGQVFVGESGTEILYRLIRTAAVGAPEGGATLGTTLEHPASRSALAQWAAETGRSHRLVAHDDATGTVSPEAYAAAATPEVRVATVVHTSPVTGMAVDVAGVVAAVRAVAPEALVVVDGIQHASHGHIDIAAIGCDGYAISPYKVFSRHGYGIGWASDRLTALPRERLLGGPEENWELGTRDTGAYATFSDVVAYFEWLGGEVSDAPEGRPRIEAAARAIRAHEARLTDAMLFGAGDLPGFAELPGLAELSGVVVVGGVRNPAREGLVSFWVEGRPSAEIVAALNAAGVRAHIRKADHYSGNILAPLGRRDCVRVSLCHYNTEAEVAQLLAAMREMSVAGA